MLKGLHNLDFFENKFQSLIRHIGLQDLDCYLLRWAGSTVVGKLDFASASGTKSLENLVVA